MIDYGEQLVSNIIWKSNTSLDSTCYNTGGGGGDAYCPMSFSKRYQVERKACQRML